MDLRCKTVQNREHESLQMTSLRGTELTRIRDTEITIYTANGGGGSGDHWLAQLLHIISSRAGCFPWTDIKIFPCCANQIFFLMLQ